jgi:hypothetical protein
VILYDSCREYHIGYVVVELIILVGGRNMERHYKTMWWTLDRVECTPPHINRFTATPNMQTLPPFYRQSADKSQPDADSIGNFLRRIDLYNMEEAHAFSLSSSLA